MSAFMCSPEHIARLVEVGTRTADQHSQPCSVHLKILDEVERVTMHRTDHAALEVVLFRLVDANVKSLRARYGKTDVPLLHDYERALEIEVCRPRRCSVVEALKLLDSYVYQSCEFKGWDRSDAARIVEALRRHYIRLLPGYEDADWSI